MVLRASIFTLAVLIAGLSAASADPVETVVVTAARLPQPVGDAAFSVTPLTAEQLQTALKGLGLYQGPADGARSPDLFQALQTYAVAQKADEVALGEWEHLTRRSLASILRHDERIPADIRQKL